MAINIAGDLDLDGINIKLRQGATSAPFAYTIKAPATTPTADHTLTFPLPVSTQTDTILSRVSSDTGVSGLQNKDLFDSSVRFVGNVAPTKILQFDCDNLSATATVTLQLPAISASPTFTLPASTSSDTLVSEAFTQTLTNKTLTTPNINEAVNLTATSTELNQLDGTTVGGTGSGDIVTIDGTQTLSNKTLSDPIIDATNNDIDTAGATDINIGGTNAATINLSRTGQTTVVKGDLQVDGTTTTVNSTTLEVTDPNITINDGGNQASADDTAGLTVEMSDATDAKLIYDKDAASFWRLGEAGSEVEVADISTAQTLTNKTIDAENNTISNLAHGSEVDNPTSGVHGVTGNVVGTSDTQTLTNKTLTSPNVNEAVALTSTATELNQLDGVSVGGTSAGDIATIDGTQTLTNKTLTTPQINTSATVLAEGSLILNDADNSNSVSLKSTATVTSDYTLVLPDSPPSTANEVLSFTNSAGTVTATFTPALTSALATDHIRIGNGAGLGVQVDTTTAVSDTAHHVEADATNGLTLKTDSIRLTTMFAAGAEASASARGVVSTGAQVFAGAKTFNNDVTLKGDNRQLLVEDTGGQIAVELRHDSVNDAGVLKLSENGGVQVILGADDTADSYINLSTGHFGLGTAAPTATLNVEGDVIFNDQGNDVDFRVEGDTEPNLLFCDASTDRVGIGSSAPITSFSVDPGSFDLSSLYSATISPMATFYDVSAGGDSSAVAIVSDNSGSAESVLYLGHTATNGIHQRGITGKFSGNLELFAGGSTGLVIDSSQRVGIGTTSPDEDFTVVSDNNAGGSGGQSPIAEFENTATTVGTINLKSAQSFDLQATAGAFTPKIRFANNGKIEFFPDDGTVADVVFSETGVVRIPGLSASSDVQTDASSNLITTSDMRLKNNLGYLESGLSIVNALKPVYYTWKDTPEAPRELGFMAQETREVLPEAAPYNKEKDLWGFSTRAVVAALTRAVQELSAKVEALENV